MIVTHAVQVDLLEKRSLPALPIVREDSLTRALAIELTAGGSPWPIPQEAAALVRYRKSDGTGGCYDTLPDGRLACTITDNVLTCILAPQVSAVQGPVQLAVSLVLHEQVLSTFQLELLVQGLPEGEADSESYRYVTAFLPQPQQAAPGQLLAVGAVSQDGKVVNLVAVNGAQGSVGGFYRPSVRTLSDTQVVLGFDASDPAMQPTGYDFLIQLPQGPAGPEGPAGAQGPAGADGYTPVRGKDYFTPTDVQLLIARVAASLPKYDGEVVA